MQDVRMADVVQDRDLVQRHLTVIPSSGPEQKGAKIILKKTYAHLLIGPFFTLLVYHNLIGRTAVIT